MTDIFDDSNPSTPPVVVPPPTPTVPDSLKDLVGDGKKYASVDKALESIPHAQAHIARLEQEMAEVRAKMAESVAAEEVYKKLTESFNRDGVTPPVVGLDEASAAALFDKRLAEHKAAEAARENGNRVRDALVGKYGDKAQEVYNAKAQELGVGVEFLNEVVRRSPKAAEELFGIKPKETPAGSSTPSIRTDALNNTRTEPPAPSVMGGATTGQLIDAWRRAKPQT